MVRTQQPGQTVFRSILPEDIDWKPFPAFPPSVRLAALGAGPLHDKGQSAIRRETHASQAPGGPCLHGPVGRFLHRSAIR